MLPRKLLIEKCSPRVIVSIGFAGSCVPHLHPGSVVVPATLLEAATGKSFRCAFGRGQLVTLDRVAGKALKQEAVRALWRLGRGYGSGRSCRCGRRVQHGSLRRSRRSPTARRRILDSSPAFVKPEGFETGRFVAHIALRPGLWPSVAALNRNSRLAAAALAERGRRVHRIGGVLRRSTRDPPRKFDEREWLRRMPVIPRHGAACAAVEFDSRPDAGRRLLRKERYAAGDGSGPEDRAQANCWCAFIPAASAAPTSRRFPPARTPRRAFLAMRWLAWWWPAAPASPALPRGTASWSSTTSPAATCYYCQRKVFSQCPVYKRVGTTAGFGEPSGGGFAEYIRVMDWIVEKRRDCVFRIR